MERAFGIEGIWSGSFLTNPKFGLKKLEIHMSDTENKPLLQEVLLNGEPIDAKLEFSKEGKNHLVINSEDQGLRYQGELIFRDEMVNLKGYLVKTGYLTSDGYVQPVDMDLFQTPQGEYIGELKTLSEEQSLLIRFSKQSEDGEMQVQVENPERNFSMFLNVDRAKFSDHDDTRLKFLSGQDLIFEGKILRTEESIEVVLPLADHEFPVKLMRLPKSDWGRFYPRHPFSSEVLLSLPEDLDDGLTPTSPEDLGWDPRPLQALVKNIINSGTKVHSLLVLSGNKLVVEEYFFGYRQGDIHDTRSLSKSFAAILTGLTVDKELLPGMDVHVLNQLDIRAGDISNWDERKRDITIRHLLTMSSGLDMNDYDDDSPGHEERMSQSEDWYNFVLDLPLVATPGTRSRYGTAGVNLVGKVLQRVCGPLHMFVNDHLFAPLGIDTYYLNLDPQGNVFLGGGWRIRPRDLAKVGVMLNQKGKWQGRQIISEEWIRKMLSHQTEIEGDSYALTWWQDTVTFQDLEIEFFHASGNGGQFLFVIPSLEITIVINGGYYMQFPKWIRFKDYLSNNVLPSILKPVTMK